MARTKKPPRPAPVNANLDLANASCEKCGCVAIENGSRITNIKKEKGVVGKTSADFEQIDCDCRCHETWKFLVHGTKMSSPAKSKQPSKPKVEQ